MGNLGLQELVVIFAVGLFLLGPRRLPEIARAFGEALRAFQEALKGSASDEQATKTHQDPD